MTIRAGLDAIEHILPQRVVHNDELVGGFVDDHGEPLLTANIFERLTGVRERRWADPGVYSSDLAAEAGVKALASAGLTPIDVDMVVFASASHDLAEPATANRVQMLTGCVGARCMDVKNACNSFLDGLEVARVMVETGTAKVVLVATGEVISPFIQTEAIDGVDSANLLAGLTLGDAGAAAVVRPWGEASIARIGAGVFRTRGEHWDGSRIMAGGSMTGRDFDQAYFWSDSPAILDLAVEHVPEVIAELLEANQWGPDDVDLVVPHQASIGVIRRICSVSGIGFDRCVITADRLGNTAAASIPVALSLAQSTGRTDDAGLVLLVGGAAGFSAASVPLMFG